MRRRSGVPDPLEFLKPLTGSTTSVPARAALSTAITGWLTKNSLTPPPATLAPPPPTSFLADEGTSETYTQTGAPFLTVPITGSTVLQDCSPWTNVTNDLYYSNQGQVLETRANGTVTTQSVWGLDYVNDLVAYDTNSTSGSLGVTGSGLGQRLYAEHDANYDVTSLTDTSGNVLERYEYTPYGTVTVLNPDGTVLGDGTMASSNFGVPYLFQGMRYDSFTGLYETPNRDLNPATGTWLQADPAGYIDGSDAYQFADSSPFVSNDPTGESGTKRGEPPEGEGDDNEILPPKDVGPKAHNRDLDPIHRMEGMDKSQKRGFRSGKRGIEGMKKTEQDTLRDLENQANDAAEDAPCADEDAPNADFAMSPQGSGAAPPAGALPALPPPSGIPGVDMLYRLVAGDPAAAQWFGSPQPAQPSWAASSQAACTAAPVAPPVAPAAPAIPVVPPSPEWMPDFGQFWEGFKAAVNPENWFARPSPRFSAPLPSESGEEIPEGLVVPEGEA
jgi:RHS repeat-associated protein